MIFFDVLHGDERQQIRRNGITMSARIASWKETP
ncbi:hypothetical protein P3T21_003749 [Paraburkholderia sp. GAS334]